MEFAIVIGLWCAILIFSGEQMTEFKSFVNDLYDTYKRRKRIKNAIHTYQHFYDRARADYAQGFYYGKIGSLKLELKEIKYFGKE